MAAVLPFSSNSGGGSSSFSGVASPRQLYEHLYERYARKVLPVCFLFYSFFSFFHFSHFSFFHFLRQRNEIIFFGVRFLILILD